MQSYGVAMHRVMSAIPSVMPAKSSSNFDWQDGTPEPFVDFEVNYVPHAIPISRACMLVWNCTDIVPGSLVDSGLDIKGRTYAACARAMHAHVKAKLEASQKRAA